MDISPSDRSILRDLARQLADIADLPIQAERRAMWMKHNRCQRVRPMVLVYPEGSWREIHERIPVTCEGDLARGIEANLRSTIYHHEHLRDDAVIEKEWIVRKVIHDTGWGLEPKWTPSDDPNGAAAFDPVLLEPADLDKLAAPTISVDEEASQTNLAEAQDLFGDILDVTLRGVSHVSFHLMNQYTAFRGLGQAMMDMVAEPQLVHDAMAFFAGAQKGLIEQYVALNLLECNNDATYQSSGGNGYTDELPAPGFDPDRVRPCDLWASAEAQEMAQVSPAMHEEFCFQYERKLLEPFGLTGYGCCEDLTRKLDGVLSLPHMRRISIAPGADVDRCAEQLGDRAIFSWKPQPAQLCGRFDPDHIRAYLRHTLDVTRDCVVEIVLKDTHTCDHHPERFSIWTDIAQELAAEY